MNKKLMKLIGLAVAATTLFSLTGCSETVKGKTLAKAATPTELSYAELKSEEFLAFAEKCNDFSATFATESFSDYAKKDNFAVSPVSVFMSLAMAAECSNGNTREEILDTFREYGFGHSPAAPEKLDAEIVYSSAAKTYAGTVKSYAGKAIIERINLSFDAPYGRFSLPIKLIRPIY